MNKLLKTLKSKNITCGYLYFYIHFVTEIACFYYLSKVTHNSNFVWIVPLIYDGLAFVPQSIFGYINDKHPKIVLALYGTILMIIAYILNFCTSTNLFISLFLLCIGNAFMHINGAETTLKISNGKLSHSAIFVSGGSFGVVTGRLLATSFIPFWAIIALCITLFPFILLAETYKTENSNTDNFNYAINSKPILVILLATLVVIVRGYVGYGIPTSWNKTIPQLILFYCIMGIGKALGGILSDTIGIRKVAFISTIVSIPFLCFGDNIMIVSIIGIMMFSMTMAITLGILVSVLKKSPGLAFGFTTIGLFLGTIPIFFVKITSFTINICLIITMSILCCLILLSILKKEGKNDEMDL
jgi:hypothetical protein